VALDAVGRLTSKAELATCNLLHRVDEAGNFLRIPDGFPVAFPAAQIGGLANPDTVLRAVSAVQGAIPTGAITEMFGQAKLLGVQLLDLLPAAPGLPDLTTVQVPDKVTTTYDWTPALKTGQTTGIILLEAGSVLHLNATVVVSIDLATGQPRPPTSTVHGSLTKVTISLLGVIKVRFEELKFLDEPNKTPAVTATGVTVEFDKDLRFVEELAKEIKDFASGSPIHVDTSGITAGYDLALPDAAVGVFSLTNVALGAEVTIPFTGTPASVRFNFGERQAPFNLSVDGLGGGGFFAFRASTKELELIEASLEFGGHVEIAVFVATGQVYAMGGVSLKRTPMGVTVGGYLRCGGHVEVLDLVQVSIEFEMGLSYTNDGHTGHIEGRASVTVSVSVLLFHESVSFEVHKSFDTDGVPNPFDFEVDEADWNSLCEAFA
jgi:hypothetical protein